MDLACTICSDSFESNSNVHITACGHMFHIDCLSEWLSRAQNCPQCRRAVVNKDLRKVYFSIGSVDEEDKKSLRNKLQHAKYELSLRTKDINFFREQHERARAETEKLRIGKKAVEDQLRRCKEQLNFFKNKSKEYESLAENLSIARARIQELERIRIMMEGSHQEINTLMGEVHDIETLVIMNGILRKTIAEVRLEKSAGDKKVQNLEQQLRTCHQKIVILATEKLGLQTEMSELTERYERLEKEFARRANVSNEPRSQRPPQKVDDEIIDLTRSDSPPPSSSRGTENSTAGNTELGFINIILPPLPPNQVYTHFSLFRKVKPNCDVPGTSRQDDLSYNGLGGKAREEVFPSTSYAAVGAKRPKLQTTSSKK